VVDFCKCIVIKHVEISFDTTTENHTLVYFDNEATVAIKADIGIICLRGGCNLDKVKPICLPFHCVHIWADSSNQVAYPFL